MQTVGEQTGSSTLDVGTTALELPPFNELPASTTSYVTITETVTDVFASTTVVITGTGHDPGYRNVSVVVSVARTIPIYTFMPVPSPTRTFSDNAACTPTSSLKILSQHYQYDCYCDCGSGTTDVVWWGTDYWHQSTTSWCTFQPSTVSPATPTKAPESYTSVYTGCAVAMPSADPVCSQGATHAGLRQAVSWQEMVQRAQGPCGGSEDVTSGANTSFPLNMTRAGLCCGTASTMPSAWSRSG